ncbi:STAS domain-containing protein [Streptomyces sp. NPDC093801]|uniref:STAS domain-containing protein n=1 Tax=Streptomyces sp. NPDC093801 TaxID=3155203 RepID=UPI00344CFD68
MHAFDIQVTERPGRTVVALAGELDLATCTCVTEATAAIALKDLSLVLELSALTFLGPTGLNLLLGLRRRARDEGGTLTLSGLPDQARRVLDLTGTRHLFALCPRPAP